MECILLDRLPRLRQESGISAHECTVLVFVEQSTSVPWLEIRFHSNLGQQIPPYLGSPAGLGKGVTVILVISPPQLHHSVRCPGQSRLT